MLGKARFETASEVSSLPEDSTGGLDGEKNVADAGPNRAKNAAT